MGGQGSGRKPYGKTKLTPELQESVVQLVKAGNYIDTAAACCGVHTSTLKYWLRKGAQSPRGRYGIFATAVKEAEAHAEASAVVRVRKFGKTHWQAEAWYLERRLPRKWGRQDRPTEEPSREVERAREIMQDKKVRDLLDSAARQLSVVGDAGSPSGKD